MGFKTVCPYCFERFNRTRAPFRLTAAGCDQAPDEIVGEFLSVPAPQLGTVFGPDEPPTGMNQRICPRCHMSLPHAAAKGELRSMEMPHQMNRAPTRTVSHPRRR